MDSLKIVQAISQHWFFASPLARYMFVVEKGPCERSSFWRRFLSSFLASQYGVSPACYVTTQKLARNTGQTAEKKEDSLTEGVRSNSIGGNLLVPSDQETLWRAKRQETEITHVRWCSQVFWSKKNTTQHHNEN